MKLRLAGHRAPLTGSSFSPDGRRVVTTSEDGSAVIWDRTNGAQLRRVEVHADAVSHAVWSPDGSKLLTASWDGTAALSEVATGTLVARYQHHTS
ncbi:hypothetical protein EBZ35_02075, partial [bacterium]|nr:hypothetical protein [bacterium]